MYWISSTLWALRVARMSVVMPRNDSGGDQNEKR
jgi:hypothetical protein